MPFILRMQNPV